VLLEPRLGELKENKLELLPGREPDRALLELAPRLDEPEEKLLPGRLAEELLPRPLKLKLPPPLGLELPMLLLEKLGIDGALRTARRRRAAEQRRAGARPEAGAGRRAASDAAAGAQAEAGHAE
jgi:hypothetical protein